MSEFLKIGGKYTNEIGEEIAKGIAVDSKGCIEIIRNNETKYITLINNIEKRDTSTITISGNNAIDLSEWTTCSIFITNTLDVEDAYLQFYSQNTATGTKYLRNADNKNIKLTLKQTGAGTMICSPDDFPILNYLKYFKCGVYFPTAPTSGAITIDLLLKR